MRSPVAAWTHFWFDPAAPFDLGAARVLFFTGLAVMYGTIDFSPWGAVSSAFWMPHPLFSALHLTPLPPAALQALQIVWRVSLCTSAIGAATRISTVTAFVLGFYLVGLPHNFGHTYHFDATLVIAMGILACSRCGDAWSVDARRRAAPAPSGDYRWPIRAVWVAMALVFLSAGIAKLRHGGLEWMFSDNLAIVLTRAAYHVSDADPITSLGLFIAQHAWLSRGLAITTVVVELGFVSALFSRRARLFFVPAAALMLVGIRVLMGPTFGGFLIANVFWVPWQAVWAWSTTRVRRVRTVQTSADVSTIA